jgi:Ni,Fe-hydrogenase I cytochrome b subunit
VRRYTDQAISSLNPDPAVSYLFKVHYSIDLSNYEATFTTLTVVSLVLAGVLWLYRMYVFFRRRRNSNLDWEAMMYAAFQACGAVALWLFLQCTGIALYWLAFYKGQDAVFNMVRIHQVPHSMEELYPK